MQTHPLSDLKSNYTAIQIRTGIITGKEYGFRWLIMLWEVLKLNRISTI